ncbi:MipA/OmpV family protein [Pseudomonas aeruginosa]|uniref:MipA/OmpV family protein n=1 Tax=Stenotrophomonas TaxID=40323 RepID=UPI0007B23FEB|nr:MipA/OmpV family protein [Stenotrophomonas maltophilia]HBN8683287.1 MipA/OmpV family protein [Pseudomonas aeruginosa]KZE42247.1 hypothetical protein AVW14_19955 [Stenotrophomonas maltophilia]OHY66907.1 hypothetical protein BB780_15765 [Stenotrophomonas maltophilia]HBO4390796.1 MipA/OmpV family protein [Pseudomonas aeruginosa]HEJ5934948.1 MipA/OmpV family protein [Pseudomonas aeruginosa]
MPKKLTGTALALTFLFLSSKPFSAMAYDAWLPEGEQRIHGLIGLGVASIPDSPGSDEQRTIPLPVLNLQFADTPFYVGNPYGASPLQAGVAWPSEGNFRFGAALSTQATDPRAADSRQRAAGVEDIERGSAASVFVQWRHERFAATLTGTQALGDSEQGQTATLRLERTMTPNPRLRITFGPSATWADGENMRTYFGIPQGSGELARYEPSGGLQEIAAQVGLAYAVSPDWILGTGLRVARLQSEAKESPLVEDETQYTVSAFLARRF